MSQVEGLRVLTKGNDQGLPMGTVEDSTSLAEGLKSMAEELQVPEEWVNSLREQYAAYPEGERCFYEIPEGRFARRPPTLTRVWIVDVSGAPDAGRTTTEPPHPPLSVYEVGRAPHRSTRRVSLIRSCCVRHG